MLQAVPRISENSLDSASQEAHAARASKVLIVLHEDNVAPRFDLALGLYIGELNPDNSIALEKTLVLPHSSAEDLCRLILTEKVDTLICGGIEQQYYDYLNWKQITVIDSVIGDYQWALQRLRDRLLMPGDIQPVS